MAQQIKITQTSNADMNIGVPKNLTAVEWLVEELKSKGHALITTEGIFINVPNELFEQAKQMEKEQIINAFYDAELHNCGGLNDAENYYNYIYGTDTNKNTL